MSFVEFVEGDVAQKLIGKYFQVGNEKILAEERRKRSGARSGNAGQRFNDGGQRRDFNTGGDRNRNNNNSKRDGAPQESKGPRNQVPPKSAPAKA